MISTLRYHPILLRVQELYECDSIDEEIDFEYAGKGELVFDLGMGIVGWCFCENKLSKNRVIFYHFLQPDFFDFF